MGKIPLTVNGFEPAECISALQKAIRRCEPDSAAFWVAELEMSGCAGWAWKRLLIITSEDCGLALEPGVVADVWALRGVYRELAGRHREDGRLALMHATTMLATSKKSRLLDWMTIWFFSRRVPRREIPDVALDKYTAAGRRLKRSWQHFFAVASRLEQHAEQPGEQEYRSMAWSS